MIDDDDNDLYAYDADEAPSVQARSPEEIHAECQSRIAELRQNILGLQSASAGIGHNHPPEPIGSIESLHKDLQDLDDALETLQTQPVQPTNTALPEIEKARQKTVEISNKWRGRLTKIGTDVIGGMVKEAGKRIFHGMVDEAWLNWAVVHLEAIASLAREWIIAIFPSF